jgi:fructose-1,6-bisphosphatase/inositol monophosphatase family enzyme
MGFSEGDLREVGRFLAQAAQTEIIPRFRKLRVDQVRTKTSSFDIVTEADEAAEEAIAKQVSAAFPGVLVIGEERCHANPGLLDSIGTAPLAVIIDPIDGTRNFAAGLPLFGVMAAVTIHGKVVAGAIYDPICKDTAYALREGGAWQEGEDGRRMPLRVAAAVPPGQMDAIVGTQFLPDDIRSVVLANLTRIGSSTSFRCAAHEYRLAASGGLHVLFYNKLMPWDHAAGWLLHREAGGYSAHFDGSPYAPTRFSGGLLCAPDQTSWREARSALLG